MDSFGATNIVKISDKEKCVYSGYEMTFDGAGSWNFWNNFSRNAIIFGVDNRSWSHADNFLVLGERPKTLVNQRQSFAWVCISNSYFIC